mmetsp:Transcript_4751/g.12952  ORF Transcript_4751/g.12952 Transcript_4751/m.12952 type:complete len:488 (+) Transcript_4751:201-1664(+)
MTDLLCRNPLYSTDCTAEALVQGTGALSRSFRALCTAKGDDRTHLLRARGGEGAHDRKAELVLHLIDRLLGPDHAEAAMRGDVLEGPREVVEVLHRRGEDLVADLLTGLVLLAQEEPEHGLVALGVRELVGVHVTHAADDSLAELVLSKLDLLEKLGRAIVVLPGRTHVRVAVRQVLEVAAPLVELAEASVRAAHDADAVPEVRGAEQLRDHEGGAVQLVAVRVQVGALAHIVHLRRHDDALGRAGQAGLGLRRGCSTRRQAGGVALQRRLRSRDVLLVSCDVEHLAGGLAEDAVLELLELRRNGLPVARLDLAEDLVQVLELGEARQLLVNPAGLRCLRRQPPRREDVAAGDDLGLRARFRLAHQLHEALLVVEVHRGRDLLDQGKELRDLARHGLTAEHEVGDRIFGAALVHDDRRRGDAAGGHADAAGEAHEVTLLGAELLQRAGEQRQQGLEVLRHRVQAEGDVGVDNAAGRQRVDQRLRLGA